MPSLRAHSATSSRKTDMAKRISGVECLFAVAGQKNLFFDTDRQTRGGFEDFATE